MCHTFIQQSAQHLYFSHLIHINCGGFRAKCMKHTHIYIDIDFSPCCCEVLLFTNHNFVCCFEHDWYAEISVLHQFKTEICCCDSEGGGFSKKCPSSKSFLFVLFLFLNATVFVISNKYVSVCRWRIFLIFQIDDLTDKPSAPPQAVGESGYNGIRAY